MANILVIGGTRYFGRILVRRLLESGDRVTLYTRGNTRPEFGNAWTTSCATAKGGTPSARTRRTIFDAELAKPIAPP